MLDESFKTFEPWAEKVEAEEAEQLIFFNYSL